MTNRPRIAVLTTVHPRGDTRIFVKQVKTLAIALPADVDYVVADGLGNDTSLTPAISVHDLGKPSGGRMMRALAGNVRAFRQLRRFKPVSIHFHDPELIPACLLLKAFGHKIIYDVHEDVPRQIESKYWIPVWLRRPAALLMSVAERIAAGAFDAIIVATPKIAERFPAHKTAVVQNFPIAAELHAGPAQPWAGRGQTIAYVGGISVVRGCREIVTAMELVNQTHPSRLVMAGTFIPQAFQSEITALPGWQYVDYRGHLDRDGVRDTLSSARAGLVMLYPEPNYVESYAVKFFEYMAAGLPVIASDFPLWRRIIEAAGCGLLADPHSPEQIAAHLRWVLDHPVEAEAMGQRGRTAVETIYNWDGEAAKLVEAYGRVMGGSWDHGTNRVDA